MSRISTWSCSPLYYKTTSVFRNIIRTDSNLFLHFATGICLGCPYRSLNALSHCILEGGWCQGNTILSIYSDSIPLTLQFVFHSLAPSPPSFAPLMAQLLFKQTCGHQPHLEPFQGLPPLHQGSDHILFISCCSDCLWYGPLHSHPPLIIFWSNCLCHSGFSVGGGMPAVYSHS